MIAARIVTVLVAAIFLSFPDVHAHDLSSTQDLLVKAARGYSDAQLILAFHYRDGEGVKRNYAEAMRWAHLAAGRFIGPNYPNGEAGHCQRRR